MKTQNPRALVRTVEESTSVMQATSTSLVKFKKQTQNSIKVFHQEKLF
jgi:hypothetical protein